jgi:ribosomal protein S18 acetylase RimI-like enzyme
MRAVVSGVRGLLRRRATRADLPRLLELLVDDEFGRARDTPAGDDPAYAQAFAAIEADPNQLLLVGALQEPAPDVVAMLQLTFIPGLSRHGAWRANIESVRVANHLRGRGIGAWLIGEALQIARERGARFAQLTSDKRHTDAHRFYARLGFYASHEGFKLALEEPR